MTYISSVLTDDKQQVKVWYRNTEGDRVLKRFPAPYYFYVPDEDGMDQDLYGNNYSRLDYDDYWDFIKAKKAYKDAGITLCEADIRPEAKVLSHEFYGADIGSLNITFFDIEVDYDIEKGFSSPQDPYAPISSVAIYHYHSDKTIVFVVPPDNRKNIRVRDLPSDITDSAKIVICKTEKRLLELFFEEIDDSDIISGWNSDFFDIPYIYERANKVIHKKAGNALCFNSTAEPFYRDVELFGNVNKRLVLQGRVGLDYLDVYKKFEMALKPSYKLEHVAEDELPHLPKLEYTGSLYTLYRDDFEEFIRYNIRDTIILKGLEDKKGYMATSIQMSHMATTQIPDDNDFTI